MTVTDVDNLFPILTDRADVGARIIFSDQGEKSTVCWVIPVDVLKEHCIEKKRVREAIYTILHDKYCDDKDNQEYRLLRELGL